ncbi:MAG: hypothetical protein VZS44_04940 [Bacilli bacterium]|nr:hypothetical protein [Bacilli bacterium]
MNRKNIKISLVLNILILIMVVLATIFMVTGFRFMSNTKVLAATGFTPLKFYTVDSNILVGLASLLLIIYEYLLLKGKIKKIPKYVYIFKYISTVAVSLTFLVTLLYLSPLYGSKFLFLYQNSNLFFHLLVPLFSFISYIYYEKIEIEYKYTYYGVSTMILYGIYYVINILIHMKNGKVLPKYDWYGFVYGGLFSIFIAFLVMIIITYIISLVIYKLNKPKIKKKDNL